jgi:DNA-binding CsgD family transcriptional regulator
VELTDRAGGAAARLAETAGGVGALGERERRAGVAALRARLGAAIRAGDAAGVAASADEIARWSRDPAEALGAACDAVFALVMLEGLPLVAEARARRVVEEAQRLVLPGVEAEATAFLAGALLELGQLEDAGRLAAQAVALTERLGGIPGRTSLSAARAGIHAIAASRTDWRSALAGIVEQIEAEDNPHYRLVIRIDHARLLARFSAPTAVEADGWLTAMDEDAQAAGCERCRWASVLAAAEAQARHGDPQAAQALLADWDRRYPEPRPGPAAQRAYVEALLVARTDTAAALPLFERAAELADRAGQRLLGLWIELDAAAALASVDQPAAIEALREAAAHAESIGATSEQQLAIQRLRALGVRTWRRGPTRADGTLSERERKIAELVAAGASNPEIAKALFLSRKTVERHVSNILAKLGARNRAELAALLARKGEGVPR